MDTLLDRKSAGKILSNEEVEKHYKGFKVGVMELWHV